MFNPGINAVIINSARKNQTKIETTEDLIITIAIILIGLIIMIIIDKKLDK